MNLGARTWPEVEAAGPLTLLLPLGATEQHGPHLPLDTDTTIAVALAEAAVGGSRTIAVAPALPYGSSGEHSAFPGTLSLGQAALELALVELVRSADGFAEVVVVCWHGGNDEPLDRAARRLAGEDRPIRVWRPRHAGTDLHAGHVETSLMLWLAPDRVRPERPIGCIEPLADIAGALRRDGVAAVAPNGVLGDARTASALEGRRLFDALAADLAAFLRPPA